MEKEQPLPAFQGSILTPTHTSEVRVNQTPPTQPFFKEAICKCIFTYSWLSRVAAQASSGCRERGLLSSSMRGFLVAAASPVDERGL